MSPEAKTERQETTLPVLKELLLEKAVEVHASQKPRSFTVGRVSDSVMFEAIKRYAPHVLIADIPEDGPYSCFTLPSSWYYRNVGLVCDIIVTFDPDFSRLGVSVEEEKRQKRAPYRMLPRRTKRLIFPEQHDTLSTRKTGEEEIKPRAQRPEKPKPQLEKPPRRKPEAQSTRERTIKQKGPSLVEIIEDLTTKALETGKPQAFPSFPPVQFRRIYDEAVDLLAGAPHSTHTPRLISAAVENIFGWKGYTKKGFRVSLPEFRDPETSTLRFGQLTIYPPKRTFLPSVSR